MSAPTPKPNPPCPICGNAMWLIMTEPLESGAERNILHCVVCKVDQVRATSTNRTCGFPASGFRCAAGALAAEHAAASKTATKNFLINLGERRRTTGLIEIKFRRAS